MRLVTKTLLTMMIDGALSLVSFVMRPLNAPEVSIIGAVYHGFPLTYCVSYTYLNMPVHIDVFGLTIDLLF